MMDFVLVILFHLLVVSVKRRIGFATPIEEANAISQQVVHHEIQNF